MQLLSAYVVCVRELGLGLGLEALAHGDLDGLGPQASAATPTEAHFAVYCLPDSGRMCRHQMP